MGITMLTEELGRHGDSGKAVPAAHSPEKPQAKGWKEAQEVLAPKGPPGLENSLLRGEPPFSWLRNSITGAEERQSFKPKTPRKARPISAAAMGRGHSQTVPPWDVI